MKHADKQTHPTPGAPSHGDRAAAGFAPVDVASAQPGAAAVARSPRVRAQAALASAIGSSPGMVAQRRRLQALFGGTAPVQRTVADGVVVQQNGKGKGKATPQPPPPDPAIAAKARVVLIRDEALLPATSATRASEIEQELLRLQQDIDAMTRTSVQPGAKQTVDSALTKVGLAVAAKTDAAKVATDGTKLAAKATTDAQKAGAARPKLDDFLRDIRGDLEALIDAVGADAVKQAQSKVAANADRASKFRGHMQTFQTQWQQALGDQALAWSRIPHDSLVLYVPASFKSEHETALTSLGVSLATVGELQAQAAVLEPHFAIAATQATPLADAKLASLRKAEEARALEQQAQEQATAAKQALDEAEQLKLRVLQATQQLKDAQGLVDAAQKQVEQATQVWQAAVAKLDNPGFDAETEPYMVEGYTAELGKDELAARTGKTKAEGGLTEASDRRKQAESALGRETEAHRLASESAQGRQTTTEQGGKEALRAKGESDLAEQSALAQADTARKALLGSRQELTDADQLRTLAGGQVPLNALAVFVPSPVEQKAMLQAADRAWLMALFKGGVGKDKVLALIAGFGAGLAGFRGALSAARIVDLLTHFGADEVKALHDQPNIGAAKLNDLVGNCTAATLKTYRDTMTLATLNGYLASFTPSALHELVKKMTLPTFGTVAAQFTVVALRDFAAAVGNDKLLDLTTAYTAVEIRALQTTYGNVRLKELLGGMTAAEVNAYIATVGQARLIDLMDTHHLNAAALKHYGAAWLRDWTGVDNGAFNHLLALHINGGIVSGGHDLAAFRNALDQVISGPGQPVVRQGGYTPGAPTDGVKVTYWINAPDGSELGRGSKTLIQNLAAKRVAMIGAANTSIWAAIAARTFAKAGGPWETGSHKGYHDAVRVTTFYPN